MRRVAVDTSVYSFMVTKSPEPKPGEDGAQQHVRSGENKGAPMWHVEVLMLDKENEGGETARITVAGQKPELTVHQVVAPVGLIAIPWMNNGKHGMAFKADDLRPVANGAA